jgi:hypothetical protein
MNRTLVKKAAFTAVGLVLFCGATEAIIHGAYFVLRGRGFSPSFYRSMMVRQAAAPDAGRLRGLAQAGQMPGRWPEVIHPYLGFVPDPGEGGTTVGDTKQVLSRSPERMIVGVFGGSFAAGVCNYARGKLREVLRLPGKDVQLICVCAGGYKQPQPLLALTYLLSLGGSFDLVITVDGANDVALAPIENVPQGVFPVYPRGWFWRVGSVNDPEALKYLGGLFALDLDRQTWANTFLNHGLYRSAALSLIWENRDRLFAIKRDRTVHALTEYKTTAAKSYAATGPKRAFKNPQELYEFLARVWSESSLQMKRLCDVNGIAYYHFLHPSQYVTGSKPMLPEETKVAVVQGHAYQAGIVAGYPILRRYGTQLSAAGVRFRDLTMLFEHVQESVYKDASGHLNGDGYRLVAEAIGETIQADATAMPEHRRGASPD